LPGAAVPKSQAGWQSWARAIASIGAPPKQVIFAIAWLYGPENEGEFRLEVRSGKALRKKWGGVLAGMQRAAARRDRVNTPSTKLDIIADEVRKSEERDYVRQAIDHDEFQRRTKSEAQSISRALCSLPGRGFSDQVE
jgi:hypothetical protein